MDSARISCRWQRLRDTAGAPWLITLGIGIGHGHMAGGEVAAAFPQNHAVIDDFGTLVCVEVWK